MGEKLRNMTAIYLSKGDKMLLPYRQGGRVVNNVWVGSAGGHFENDELNDPKACMLRELQEELSLGEENLRNLSLRYITFRRTKGEIRQNYYFFAELAEDVTENLVSCEGICKWFPRQELHALDMPYTARHVILHYLKTGHHTEELYVGVPDGEKVVFTPMRAF